MTNIDALKEMFRRNKFVVRHCLTDSSGNDYSLAEWRRGAIESRPHNCSASSHAISSRCVNKMKFSDAAICASCAVIVEI
jgi:hypothetical protein